FASDTLPQAAFANRVAIAGNWAVVADAERFGGAGGVYIFERTSSGWVERQILDNPDPNLQDYFGSYMALEGNTLVVSCPRDDVACPSDPMCDSGSAYIYQQSGGVWTLATRLVPTDNGPGDFFGYPVCISSGTLMVGAQHDDDTVVGSGSVYIYERTPSGWFLLQKLHASDPGIGARFGQTLVLNRNQALISAPHNSTIASVAGAVYVFERGASGWSQTDVLRVSGTFRFGDSGLGIDGDTILISGLSAGPVRIGWVRHFERDLTGWSEQVRIEPRAPRSPDDFGSPILLRGDRAIIGAERDDAAGSSAGAFYVFDRGASDEWSEVAKVLPPSLGAGDLFGISMAESQGVVLAGAWKDDEHALDAGAAYIIDIDGLRKYCPGPPNQSGMPAELSVRGTAGVQVNDLTLVAGPVAPTTGMVFYGTHAVQVPFGTLLRCVGGRLYRSAVTASGQGTIVSRLDFTSPVRPSGTILPGSTWYFQAWYRDSLNGTEHGFSDALAITFGP
ncbi:MAG: hypothetical protein ACI8QZ_001737, partial [Chlamydiales bacterium]